MNKNSNFVDLKNKNINFCLLSKGVPFDKSYMNRCIMPGLLIICIALFVGLITGTYSRVPNQKTVFGKVVSMEHKYDTGEKKPTYTATVEYSINNQTYYVKSKYKSSSFYIDQKIKVRYNALNPSQSRVAPAKSVYVVMSILIVVGIVISYQSFFN